MPVFFLGILRNMMHAAIFDMDGLLFDTERLCCDAWRAVSAESGWALEDSLFISCVGRNNRDTREIVMKALGDGFPYEEFDLKARAWMKARMAEAGPPVKPGVRELLGFLSGRKIPIALATSTSEASARWMIERAGLTAFFGAFAFGSEVRNGKPSPDIFLLAMNRLGVTAAASCVVFEDSPAGIKAAHSAGMKPVFVPDMVQPGSDVLSLVWKRIGRLDEAASGDFYRGL